jgi:hypothetical protein
MAGARLKNPVSRAAERTQVMFDKQFLILLWIDLTYRDIDDGELVLQSVVMT